MNRQSLRPIAFCVMFANSLPLLAQQPAKPPVASAGQVAPGAVEGRTMDATGKPVSNAAVRLRNIQTGKIANSLVSNSSGAFAFRDVTPGNYVVELVGGIGKAVAASPMLVVHAGQAISTFVSLPAVLSQLGGIVAENALVAAVVVASAVAAGVLSTAVVECVSPPCQ